MLCLLLINVTSAVFANPDSSHLQETHETSERSANVDGNDENSPDSTENSALETSARHEESANANGADSNDEASQDSLENMIEEINAWRSSVDNSIEKTNAQLEMLNTTVHSTERTRTFGVIVGGIFALLVSTVIALLCITLKKSSQRLTELGKSKIEFKNELEKIKTELNNLNVNTERDIKGMGEDIWTLRYEIARQPSPPAPTPFPAPNILPGATSPQWQPSPPEPILSESERRCQNYSETINKRGNLGSISLFPIDINLEGGLINFSPKNSGATYYQWQISSGKFEIYPSEEIFEGDVMDNVYKTYFEIDWANFSNKTIDLERPCQIELNSMSGRYEIIEKGKIKFM